MNNASGTTEKTLQLEKKVLSKNDEQAAENRKEFKKRGLFTLNLISSPGSGKTALLERTIELLSPTTPCAVMTGDQHTDNDAKRLSGRGAPVCQIITGNSCHLNAELVKKHFDSLIETRTRVLFIENVGNLICPAAFDLGEDVKIVLLSVTEGEDKPLKYPAVFSKADAVLLTKIDLTPYLKWDKNACLSALQKICPSAPVFPLSSLTGHGMNEWLIYLKNRSATP